ncbi:methylmalonyl Co-A mutase-associated GTPase MeaB [Brevibacillus fluminis]|uniref:Methylmalonyl Co-A mutase-associated GTPase MeaB n=1 Tax=Brevibacillus fluminis TaxID=511487 RepID=A0A3M8DK99_9BACL|nr:methylmalonyl Co-A mutase-associated GTPase MeaB [Brevibacillus fluminis]RNB87891.1 methylmalonyl Co-A mutase-associated GTPase MeaB [Brevibacillus fluminis]
MRRRLTVDEYVEGVLAANRTILAQAITLVESNAPAHMETAQEVLNRLLPHTGNSIRVGITGVPGAGKSTLIDMFGTMLCDQGHKVAVLAVDPSSTVTRGSILGDKTRMDALSRNPRAYIRPSPAGGSLGGVARKSRETMLVCEAAGFDVLLIETVGVGQSEVTVRSMVDFFLLLMVTGTGDELQTMKKGVIELADAIFVNKADGANKPLALATKEQLNQMLHYLQPATEGWESRALTCSALTGEGVGDIWSVVGEFRETTEKSGMLQKRRQTQAVAWMNSMVQDSLYARFYAHSGVKQALPAIKQAVAEGNLSVTLAANQLMKIFEAGEP